MRSIKSLPEAVLELFLAISLAGCASTGDLAPAETARAVPALDRAARVDVNEITLIAQSVAWPGEALIAQRVTPLRVTISNNGQEPVLIRYGDFKLIGSSGMAYRALPPLAISGTVDVATPRGAVIQPGFEHHRFGVASRYGPAYPGVEVYRGSFDYDRYYHDTYYGHWDVKQRLPTPEMVAVALPEGVIEPGGYVTGWLYFQKVDDDEIQVRFLADLRDPADGAPVAELEIPFDKD
jgi:hypothetical protein